MYEAGSGGSDGGGDLFTPPPGDPGTIRSHAKTLSTHGTSIGDLGQSAKRASSSLADDFRGEAADAYGKFAGGVETLATGTEEPVNTIARGINHYADALEAAQKAIKDAAHRHAAAQAASQKIADETNSNPHRTDAQVKAAQAKIDQHDKDAKDAEADARRAWTTYEHESEQAAKTIKGAGDTLDSGTKASPVRTTLEGIIKEGGEEGEEEEGAFWKYKEGIGKAFLAWDMQNLGLKSTGELLSKFGKKEAGELFSTASEVLEGGGILERGEDGAIKVSDGLGKFVYLGEDAGPEAKYIASGLKWGGRGFGALGVVSGTVDTIHDVAEGDKGKAALDGTKTLLAAGAMLPVPGLDVACGVGAAGIELYESVPAIHDAVNSVGKSVGHFFGSVF